MGGEYRAVEFGPKPFATASFRRVQLIQEGACPRFAWLTIWVAWQGWGRLRAGAELRFWAYRLARLVTPAIVVGEIVHTAFAAALRCAADRRPLPAQGDLYAAGERRLLAIRRTSRERFLTSPKRAPMFWAAFYEVPFADAFDRACHSLDWLLCRLLTHPVLEATTGLGARVHLPPPFATSVVRYRDGVEIPVIGAADGVIFRANHLELLELKTGRAAAARKQLATNAVWWMSRPGYGWKDGRYRGRVIALAAGDDGGNDQFVLTADEVAEAARLLRRAAESVHAANEAYETLPPADDWPMLPAGAARCRTCSFLALCETERARMRGDPPRFDLPGITGA